MAKNRLKTLRFTVSRETFKKMLKIASRETKIASPIKIQNFS